MAKRKKHMKLPNGFGSIKYLGKNRRKPYAVYPPVTKFTIDGVPIQGKAIGYAEDWYKAYDMLVLWKNGAVPAVPDAREVPAKDAGPTFAEVYERYYAEKYNPNSKRTYSRSSQGSTKAAYKNCAQLHQKNFSQIRYDDLQSVVDSCPLKHSSLELIVNLLKQMYKYAIKYELADKDYSQWLEIKKADDDEHGVPFSDADIKLLWQHSDDDVIALLLMMIYSGFRIGEWKGMMVDLDAKYFKGGIKTEAGKNRIVPIHSEIYPLVESRIKKHEKIMLCSESTYRSKLAVCLESIGIQGHTPHDARHTFSSLCERYGVLENDRKRMLGHAFNDITNRVYGHRTLDDLRTEIEKIKVP